MRIQHNILAMNAYRNYNNNTSALGKNLEKLSSGYKINRAGDDAAGLAISEKMRAQITGLNAAQKNVKDGISLVKTAEGAMQEIQDMLNRMDYLATQSANGTYDNEVDRLNLQKEVTALQDEINRIADSANFNGIKLLNGDMAIKDTTAGVAGGEFLDGVDGTAPAAAGAASVTFKLGTAADNVKNGGALSTAPADTFDAVGFAGDATKTKIEFTTGTLADGDKALGVELQATGGTKAKVDALGNANFNGKTIADYFDLEIGGTKTSWADAATIDFADTTKYTLVAKNAGDLGTTVSGAIDALVAAGANNVNTTPIATHGVDNTVTPAPTDTNAKHEFTVDVSKLEGGQVYEFAGKTFEIVTDGGTASGTNTAIKIDPATTATAADKAEAVRAAIAGAFTGTDFTIDGTATVDATDANVFTFKAEGAARDTASLGAFRQGENTKPTNNQNAIVGTYTAGTAAGAGTGTTFAQATWKGIDVKDLSAGAKVEITSLGQKYTVEVVDTGAKGGQINKADITDGDKWTEAFQRAGFAAGTIDFTVAADGKATAVVTGTTYDPTVNAGKGNQLITAVSVTDNKPTEVTLAGKTFEMGTATVTDLETLYGDKYDVVVKDGNTTKTTNDTVNSGYTVELKAKVKGKITDDALDDMKAIGNGAPAGTEVIASYAGHDEGTDTTGHNTKYTVTFDPTKIAGGQAFTFGNVDGKSYTFELSLDTEGTGNGNTGADENVTGKDANRFQIDLSNVAQADYVKTIKETVADKMGTNFDVTFSGNTVTAVAKDNLKADGNLGAARYSSQGGGITGVTYDPYLEKTGGAEGTYAEVTYSFDSSKLAEGDVLTIGKAGTGAGAISLTIAKETDLKNNKISLDDAQNDAKLIAAIEQKNAALGAGKQIGQVKIANGKLTITDNVTDTKAADFKGGRGFFSITNAEREKTDKGGLTLQIGDTSDEFNQMRVEIGDMHVSAMGTFKKDADGKLTKELESSIQDIDIGTQEGAQKAVDVIKNAINYVSGIRGDLGAYQNRLEHTQNNLSVMAENIQDAESTIRDTDVAEEMMSYVKNNILVQSAQAMLAQANQVPQGVLQLLG